MSLFNTMNFTINVFESDNDSLWDSGEYEKNLIDTIYPNGSWQPANVTDIQNLPEAVRNRSVFYLITETKLPQNCEIIGIKNNDTLEQVLEQAIGDTPAETYIMVGDGKNRNNIISHYEYMFVNSKEPDSGN